MTSAWPRQCMHTYATPVRATTSAIAGSARPPETSLTIRAPASTARSATTARVVSTLTTAPSAASAEITGSTRASSASTGTRPAPGRVDSPPTSRTSAPSPRSSRPCATAASGSYHSPPSENESGVTLTTPMTSMRPTSASSSSPATTKRSTGLAPQDEAHRLGARRAVAHLAAHGRRDGPRARLAHAAHRHAQVLALDDDDGPARLQVLHERVRDLGREALLDLRAPRVHLDEARELGQARDAPVDVGDVADVRDAVERHQVVLARRVHLDVLDEHHLLVPEVERRREDVGRLLAQAREDLAVGARHAGRGVAQALAVRVLADGDEQLAHGGLGAVLVVRRDVRGRARALDRAGARDGAGRGLGRGARDVAHQSCPGSRTSVTSAVVSRPSARSSGESAGTSPMRSGGSSSFAAAASSCGMTGLPFCAAFSASVSTGPRCDTARCSLESHTSRGARFSTGENTRASSAWLSVSFSRSSSTRASRTSRYCVSTSHASSCAASTSLRTSWSTVPATDSE